MVVKQIHSIAAYRGSYGNPASGGRWRFPGRSLAGSGPWRFRSVPSIAPKSRPDRCRVSSCFASGSIQPSGLPPTAVPWSCAVGWLNFLGCGPARQGLRPVAKPVARSEWFFAVSRTPAALGSNGLCTHITCCFFRAVPTWQVENPRMATPCRSHGIPSCRLGLV